MRNLLHNLAGVLPVNPAASHLASLRERHRDNRRGNLRASRLLSLQDCLLQFPQSSLPHLHPASLFQVHRASPAVFLLRNLAHSPVSSPVRSRARSPAGSRLHSQVGNRHFSRLLARLNSRQASRQASLRSIPVGSHPLNPHGSRAYSRHRVQAVNLAVILRGSLRCSRR